MERNPFTWERAPLFLPARSRRRRPGVLAVYCDSAASAENFPAPRSNKTAAIAIASR